MHVIFELADDFVWTQEYKKYDKVPSKYIKQWSGVKPKTGAPYSCDIGYERFLGPEVVLYMHLASIYVFPGHLHISKYVEGNKMFFSKSLHLPFISSALFISEIVWMLFL